MSTSLPKKKICHITTAHTTFDTRIFRRECQSLVQAGYDVTLLAPHSREEVVEGVRILPLRTYPRKLNRRIFSPISAVKKALSEPYDLYHFHDPELMPAMQYLARKIECPIIWDAHELYISNIQTLNQLHLKPLSWIGGHLFGHYELFASKRSFSGVITITEKMAERYRRKGISARAVGNFIESHFLEYPQIPKDEPPLIVLSSSTMAERYGAILLLEAFRRVRSKVPCRLAYWCRFTEAGLEERLRSLSRDYGLSSDIEISGPHPRLHLLNDLMPRASIGVISFLMLNNENVRVAVPNRLAEYWSRGLSVVATHQTNVADTIIKAGGGFSFDNSVEDLAEKLEHLVKNPQQIKEMGERGRSYARHYLNWDSAFANLLHLYDEVLEKASARFV